MSKIKSITLHDTKGKTTEVELDTKAPGFLLLSDTLITTNPDWSVADVTTYCLNAIATLFAVKRKEDDRFSFKELFSALDQEMALMKKQAAPRLYATEEADNFVKEFLFETIMDLDAKAKEPKYAELRDEIKALAERKLEVATKKVS